MQAAAWAAIMACLKAEPGVPHHTAYEQALPPRPDEGTAFAAELAQGVQKMVLEDYVGASITFARMYTDARFPAAEREQLLYYMGRAYEARAWVAHDPADLQRALRLYQRCFAQPACARAIGARTVDASIRNVRDTLNRQAQAAHVAGVFYWKIPPWGPTPPPDPILVARNRALAAEVARYDAFKIAGLVLIFPVAYAIIGAGAATYAGSDHRAAGIGLLTAGGAVAVGGVALLVAGFVGGDEARAHKRPTVALGSDGRQVGVTVRGRF